MIDISVLRLGFILVPHLHVTPLLNHRRVFSRTEQNRGGENKALVTSHLICDCFQPFWVALLYLSSSNLNECKKCRFQHCVALRHTVGKCHSKLCGCRGSPTGRHCDEQTWWRNGREEKRSDPCAVERGGTGDAVVVRNRLVRVAKGCF